MTTSISNSRGGRMRGSKHGQNGAATLIVVMILFFIMAMLAAFANRNLIFEQRIASNYYRSTVALEIADAGVEWTLALLNGGNLDQTCTPISTPTAGTQSFGGMYLDIDATSRTVTPKALPANISKYASCVSSAVGWVCTCPTATTWTDATNIAAAAQMQPAFAIGLETVASRPGVVKIVSLGCSSNTTASCTLGLVQTGADQLLAGSAVRTEAALVSALKSPPTMPLVVKGTVTGDAGSLGLHNTETNGNGLLLVAGGNAPSPALSDGRLDSLPGTPGQQALISNDPVLAGLTGTSAPDDMFAMYLGMPRARYKNQPAMQVLTCTECAASLSTAYATGRRMVWLTGPVTINPSSAITLGSASAPMVIVVDGDVTITGSLALNGLLYATGNITWTGGVANQSLVNGVVIGGGSLSTTGTVDFSYQTAVVNALSNGTGSFVRVPGSWWDQGGTN